MPIVEEAKMNNGLTKDFDALATDEKDAIPVIEWLKSIKDKEAVEKAMEALGVAAVDDGQMGRTSKNHQRTERQ